MPEIMPGEFQNESEGDINGLTVTALLVWLAAFLVFLGHVSNLVLAGDRSFTLTIIWLIGLGCLGAPFFGVRTLGRRLNPHACRFIAGVFGSVTVLLTVLFLVGEETPTLDDMTFALILPMAIAVQAFNAADALERIEATRLVYRARIARQATEWRAAVERAQNQHLERCMVAEYARQRELAEVVDIVMGLPDAEARVVQVALERRAAVASSRDDPRLHVVHINGTNRG